MLMAIPDSTSPSVSLVTAATSLFINPPAFAAHKSSAVFIMP
jgi:hypothetical protein